MKKSRKQRKLETARRIAKEEQQRIAARKMGRIDYETSGIATVCVHPDIHCGRTKNYSFDIDKIASSVKTMSLNDIMGLGRIGSYHDVKSLCKPDHYIVKAAILDNTTGEIFSGELVSYHSDIQHEFKISERDRNFTFGFLDNKGSFLTRSEAGEVAFKARQCDEYYRNSLQSNGYRHIL